MRAPENTAQASWTAPREYFASDYVHPVTMRLVRLVVTGISIGLITAGICAAILGVL